MKNTKILYLPLDERPCNYKFPFELIQALDEYEMIEPTIDILGNKKEPSDFKKVYTYLINNIKQVDILIISMDQLLYGGIVPSRIHNIEFSKLKERLNTIIELKALNKNVKIYAFSLIMRCPAYSNNDEEPDYYNICGKEINETGVILHKEKLGILSHQEVLSSLDIIKNKTKGFLDDFVKRRYTNQQMNKEIISLVGKYIDYLIIPQDDCSIYGYPTMDRESLMSSMSEDEKNKIMMFPGADEVGMTLLARSILENKNKRLKVYLEYPNEYCDKIIPLYEGWSLKKTVEAQIKNTYCCLEENKSKADIILYMNYPFTRQIEVVNATNDQYENRNITTFLNKLVVDLKIHNIVGFVDGYYANGGDIETIKILSSMTSLFNLTSYAGWNTSSNTLGTVIAQCALSYFTKKSEKQECFLAKRFYEDLGYCAHVRKEITTSLKGTKYQYFDTLESNGYVSKLVEEHLSEFFKENIKEVYDKYKISKCLMPWKRMFEVDIDIEKR